MPNAAPADPADPANTVEPADPAEPAKPAADPAKPAAEPASHGRSARRIVIEIAETLLLTLVIFLVIQNFVAQPFKVEGQSMEMTFVEGDFVLVDRLTPRWSPYDRGQVVVLKAPDEWSDRGEPFIKRVIGIAGDTVEIGDDGTVAVNGAVLDEPYLFRDESGAIEPTLAEEGASWVVPDGDVFVMGDHRQASMDSRAFGPIAVSTIIGRGVVRYWPVGDIGIVTTPDFANVPAP